MILWLLLLAVLVGMAGIAILNTLTFPRLRRVHHPVWNPAVSILVPARNEADKIGETVRRLLAQDYPDLEVLVLDDHSSDATADEALQAAGGDRRFRLLHGQPLPLGWLGKNWACQQLGEAARGEVLIFSDADVRWEAGALNAALDTLERTRAGLLTVWPTQVTVTWGERLVTPLMTFAVLAYLPDLAVRYIPWAAFAAANGQFLACRKEVYLQIGGHTAVRASVLDDMSLAWNVKRAGQRLSGALGCDLLWTRMYNGWDALRAGFAKNILAGHANQPVLLMLSTAFHWLVFLIPWVWLPLGAFWPDLPKEGWPEVPAALIALGLSLRLLTAATSGQRLADAFLLPVSVTLMTAIAAQSLIWHWRGGASWKGRKLSSS